MTDSKLQSFLDWLDNIREDALEESIYSDYDEGYYDALTVVQDHLNQLIEDTE